MAATQLLAGGLFLLATFTGALAGEWCYEYGDSIFDTGNTLYCSSSCCGDMYNRYCCWDMQVGTIVGIVIGCLVAVGVIITIIVIVCCCKRRPGRAGVVFGGTQPAATTVVTTGNNTQMGTVGMAPGTYPYGQGQTNAGYAGYAGYPSYPGQSGVPPPMGAAGYPAPGPQEPAKFQPPPAYDTVQQQNAPAPN